MTKKRDRQPRAPVAASKPAPAAPAPEPPKPLSWPKKILFSLVPVLLLLGGGELVARMSGKDFTSKRFFYVAGGHEEYYGTSKLSVPYQRLPPYHWTGVPNVGFFNTYGFRGGDWPVEKKPGTTRIAIMGCSCTLGGQEPYADRIQRVLREALGEQKYETLNFGIGSSSTHQILQIFEQDTLKFKPDVATLFGGWNDRWVHDGRRDAQHKLPSATSAGLWDFLSTHSQLFKALVFFADQRAKPQQRVPPADYARNLRTFVKLCRDHGIKPVLCTTPDGSPEMEIENRFAQDKKQRDWDSDLYDIYKDKESDPVKCWNYIQKVYNDTVKKVAQDEKVDLIDLDTEVQARRKAYAEPPFFFFKDGVHFAELGLQELACIYAQHLAQGDDRAKLDAYLASPAYFATNAWQFASQFQHYVSDEFLKRAEKSQGAPVQGVDALVAAIASNKEFYKTFDMARIEWSDKGDLAKVDTMMKACLQMRPDDQNLRLELAQLAMNRERYDEVLTIALGADYHFTPDNMHRALWLGVDAANNARRGEVVLQCLKEIRRLFPQDQRAQQILAQNGIP